MWVTSNAQLIGSDLEETGMVKSMALANAMATVVAIGYVLCRLIAVIAPDVLFNVGQSWFHTLDLEPMRATRSMSMGMFVLGFVTSVAGSWVATYAVGELYKRWVD